MASADVQSLLGAVRRRLWRAQFTAAARRACWGTAGLMLLVVAVHLAAPALPVAALVLAAALPWASMMAWASWRRPDDPACALWADRRLGGASAYSTWLEVRAGRHGGVDAPAVQRLENWASARLPDSLHRLAGLPASAHLSRPLLSMGVCTALATLVLALPQVTPASRPPPAASAPSAIAERALASAPAAAELVSEIASALRTAGAPDAAPRGAAGGQSAAGQGPGDEGRRPAALQDGGAAAGAGTAAAQASADARVDAHPGAAQATGASGGREAGDSPDQRADVGVSRGLRGSIAVQRSALSAGRPAAEWQADIDRSASYGEEPPTPGAAAPQSGPAPAAATPPAAIDATRLTPTETSYVQAWMKASGRGR